MCELCEGPVMLLGVLGSQPWGRCRNCGMDQTVVVEEWED